MSAGGSCERIGRSADGGVRARNRKRSVAGPGDGDLVGLGVTYDGQDVPVVDDMDIAGKQAAGF